MRRHGEWSGVETSTRKNKDVAQVLVEASLMFLRRQVGGEILTSLYILKPIPSLVTHLYLNKKRRGKKLFNHEGKSQGVKLLPSRGLLSP